MYQQLVNEKKITVLSLSIFHEHRKTVLFRVLVFVIHTIINNYIFIDYMILIQDKLSKYNNKFEGKSPMIYIGWEYLKF